MVMKINKNIVTRCLKAGILEAAYPVVFLDNGVPNKGNRKIAAVPI
jgi:hypothetical protein